MNNLIRITIIVVVAFAAISCKQRFVRTSDRDLLARVGDKALYEHEVTSIFTPGMTGEDSVKLLKSYIDRWVKTQLKIQEAEKVFESSQDDIDRMVEDYRNALLTNKIDQYYIDQRIDTLFPDELIRSYYEDNKRDFLLDKSIIKGTVIKVPKSYRQQADLKKLMMSSRSDDYKDMVSIAMKNSFEITEFSNWTDFGQLQSILPNPASGDYDNLLSTAKVHEINSGNDIYLIRITSLLGPGDYSPYESVHDVIKRFIFNKRKQEIIETREDSLFNIARKNKDIIINVN